MTLLLVCNLNCYFVFVSEVLEEDQQLLLQPTFRKICIVLVDLSQQLLYNRCQTVVCSNRLRTYSCDFSLRSRLIHAG